MHIICGADGCRGAWFAVFQDLDTGSISWHTYATAHELFCHLPMAQIIALDIPIGLPNEGPRACDIDARRILGPGRGSSVFPAPIRPVLGATSYADACRIRFEVEGKKMSCQAWNIVSKVREVDELLRRDPELQARVREVHPELSFYFLAGQRPPAHKKKDRNGRQERLGLLEPVFGQRPQDALLHRDKRAAQDDVLDAFATLWTAGRIVAGEAQCLPAVPPADSCGVRMAIVA